MQEKFRKVGYKHRASSYPGRSRRRRQRSGATTRSLRENPPVWKSSTRCSSTIPRASSSGLSGQITSMYVTPGRFVIVLTVKLLLAQMSKPLKRESAHPGGHARHLSGCQETTLPSGFHEPTRGSELFIYTLWAGDSRHRYSTHTGADFGGQAIVGNLGHLCRGAGAELGRLGALHAGRRGNARAAGEAPHGGVYPPLANDDTLPSGRGHTQPSLAAARSAT